MGTWVVAFIAALLGVLLAFWVLPPVGSFGVQQ